MDEVSFDNSRAFEEWGKEEVELQHRNLEEKMEELAEDGVTGNELPEYMLKLIVRSTKKSQGMSDPSKPSKVGKLPIIAVGRPNTGKSTIVNKLTNSHKG